MMILLVISSQKWWNWGEKLKVLRAPGSACFPDFLALSKAWINSRIDQEEWSLEKRQDSGCKSSISLPGRSQIQQYQGCRWRRLPVSVCGPGLCWSCEPATWRDAHTSPLPRPQWQSPPARGDAVFTNAHLHLYSFMCQNPTCSLVWAFCTYSRPTLILGVRMARVNSSTLMPSRWHSFWAAVLSGMDAWSWFFSLLKDMFPNWSTAEITFSMAEEKEEHLSKAKADTNKQTFFRQ